MSNKSCASPHHLLKLYSWLNNATLTWEKQQKWHHILQIWYFSNSINPVQAVFQLYFLNFPPENISMFYEAIIGSTMHIALFLHLTNIPYNYDAAHALILFHYFKYFSDIISSFKLPCELGKRQFATHFKNEQTRAQKHWHGFRKVTQYRAKASLNHIFNFQPCSFSSTLVVGFCFNSNKSK